MNVEVDENFELVPDDDGRTIIKILAHDIVIKTFERELELFGLPSQYKHNVQKLAPIREKAAR